MKAMCINEGKNFMWQDVPEPECHDEFDVNLLWRRNLRVIGSTLRSRTPEEKAQILAGLVSDVWPAFEARKFAPFVHKVMPVTEATEAHAILERGENRGKVVLTVEKFNG